MIGANLLAGDQQQASFPPTRGGSMRLGRRLDPSWPPFCIFAFPWLLIRACEIYITRYNPSMNNFWAFRDLGLSGGLPHAKDCTEVEVMKAVKSVGKLQYGKHPIIYQLSVGSVLFLDDKFLEVTDEQCYSHPVSDLQSWIRLPCQATDTGEAYEEEAQTFFQIHGPINLEALNHFLVITRTPVLVKASSPVRSRMENPGNYCFLNAALQLLYTVTPFREMLDAAANYVDEGTFTFLVWAIFEKMKTGATITKEDTYDLVEKLLETRQDLISESGHVAQQDSFEYLTTLVDKIDLEIGTLNPEYRPWLPGPLFQIFGMRRVESKICDRAQSHYQSQPDIASFLTSQHIKEFPAANGTVSIKQIIMNNFSDDPYKVITSGHTKDCNHRKHFQVTHMPSYLVVSLPKFDDSQTGLKNPAKVKFYADKTNPLDLSQLIRPADGRAESAKYELVGLAVHESFQNSGTSGHYYAYVLSDTKPPTWLIVNDSKSIRQVDIKALLPDLEGAASYLLYRRIPSKDIRSVTAVNSSLYIPEETIPMKSCGSRPKRMPTRRKTHETRESFIDPLEPIGDDEVEVEKAVNQQSTIVPPTTPADQKEPTKSSASKWIAIIFVILLLIGGGLGASYWLGYIKKEHFSIEFIRLWKLPYFTKE